MRPCYWLFLVFDTKGKAGPGRVIASQDCQARQMMRNALSLLWNELQSILVIYSVVVKGQQDFHGYISLVACDIYRTTGDPIAAACAAGATRGLGKEAEAGRHWDAGDNLTADD